MPIAFPPSEEISKKLHRVVIREKKYLWASASTSGGCDPLMQITPPVVTGGSEQNEDILLVSHKKAGDNPDFNEDDILRRME